MKKKKSNSGRGSKIKPGQSKVFWGSIVAIIAVVLVIVVIKFSSDDNSVGEAEVSEDRALAGEATRFIVNTKQKARLPSSEYKVDVRVRGPEQPEVVNQEAIFCPRYVDIEPFNFAFDGDNNFASENEGWVSTGLVSVFDERYCGATDMRCTYKERVDLRGELEGSSAAAFVTRSIYRPCKNGQAVGENNDEARACYCET